MKSLLGALALIAVMGAGAWSSDALSGFDAPERDRHGQQHAEDKAADKAEKAERRAERKAERSEQRTGRKADKPAHPHGGPPGQQQRGRGEPPDWAGGPDQRTAEPPGQAKKPADHPAKSHGRP